jgi:tetratricopeptide (TPR) repeat protein
MRCHAPSLVVLAVGTLALLASARPGHGQDWRGNGRIEGVVTDEDGKPLADVSIKAECPERGGGPSLKSDKKGRWVVGGIVACGWNLDFTVEGFETKKITVNLPAEAARLQPVRVPLKKSGPPPELKAAAEKADAAYKAGRFAEARAEYEKALAMRPDLAPTINQQIGFSYIQEKQYDKALEYLEKVLAGDPGNAQIRAIAAQAALEGKMIDRARQLLGGLDETKITNPDVFFNMGVNFLNAGETQAAIEYFGKAIKVDPTYVDAYYRRALGYLQVGKTPECRADFQKVLELVPEDPPTLVTKGKYTAIEEGMALPQVQSLVGTPGEESGRSGTTVVQTWKNSDGSRLQVTFSGGRVTTKTQEGLPEGAVMRDLARKALEQIK